MTYAELLQKVRDYTEVGSSVLSDSILQSMIRDAELRIFREVDADYMREYATANLQTNSPYLELPNASGSSGTQTTRRSIIVRSFLVYDSTQSPTTKEYLDKRDTSFIFEYNSTGATGVPKYYANWKETTLIMAPAPNAQYQVQLSYIYTPDALTSTNTTTYLSNNVPDLLFYATMIQAYEFLKGPMDMYKIYSDKYNVAIQSFALEQMGRRRRDEYMDGVPRVKIPSPSPNN
tara:strand:- start:2976 stop:3674 length:699 start_codon:yes stop_codon:yes gene_type:complete